MPRKVDFSVGFVTSEDAKYRSSELNSHGPTVKGWRSQANPQYPQEIVLQLEKRCVLCKVQILAHQYMIRLPAVPATLLQMELDRKCNKSRSFCGVISARTTNNAFEVLFGPFGEPP